MVKVKHMMEEDITFNFDEKKEILADESWKLNIEDLSQNYSNVPYDENGDLLFDDEIKELDDPDEIYKRYEKAF